MKELNKAKVSLLAKSFGSTKNMREQFDQSQDHMYFKQRVSFQDNPFKMSSQNLKLMGQDERAYS